MKSVVKALCMKLTKYIAFVTCLAVAGLQTALAEPGIVLLKQEPDYKADFVLEEQDLYVKTLGDGVRLTRIYRPGKGWTWNARWADLEFIKQEVKVKFANNSSGGGGSIDFDPKPLELEGEAAGLSGYKKWGKIRRFDTDYERVAGMARFGGDSAHIVPVTGGYEWRNRKGDWIKYDEKGKTLSYGDIANQYMLNRDTQERIESVVDKFNQTLYQIKYSGDSRTPSSVMDYSGREVSYAYIDGELQSVKDVRGYEWRYVYHSGKLSQRIDPNGNATSYEFDDNRLEKIVLANGDATSYKYEYLKNISINQKSNVEFYKTTKKLPDGTVEEVKVRNSPKPTGIGFLSTDKGASGTSSSGQGILFTSATDQILEKRRNEQTLYEREVNGNLVNKIVYDTKNKIRTVTRYGETIEYVEDVWGNNTEIRYQDGRKEIAKYHATLNVPLERIDPRGVKHNYSYDGGARLTNYTQSGETESLSFIFSYSDTQRTASIGGVTYTENLDAYGNAESVVDPEGNVSTYTYNALGQATTETRPEGGVYRYSYDGAGNLLSVEDPLKRRTTFEYDSAGNLAKTTMPNTGGVHYGYNNLNERVSITNHYGAVFKTEYSHQNRVLTFTDALGNKSLVRKTPNGQVDYQKDANGNEVFYSIDDFLVRKIEYVDLSKYIEYGADRWAGSIINRFEDKEQRSTFERNKIGLVTKKTDAEYNSTKFEYDDFGRIIKFIDAEGGVTRFSYDFRGNLIKLIDPEDRVTEFTYNKNNRVISESRFPDGARGVLRSYMYDRNGNLVKEITPNSQEIAYFYDAADQLVEIKYYPLEKARNIERIVSFGYNNLGKVASYSDGVTSGSYLYNEIGELTKVTIDYGDFSKEVKYSYNKNGSLLTYTNPEGVVYSYGYDAAGNIKTVNVPGEGVIAFDKYRMGNPSDVAFPGGARIGYEVDGMSKIKSYQLRDPANNIISKVLLKYDSVGNVIGQYESDSEIAFKYDKAYRLTSADYSLGDGRGHFDNELYKYDRVDNRLSRKEGATVVDAMEYNDANQLIRDDHFNYEYDLDGNLVTKFYEDKEVRFYYNPLGRLVRVENEAGATISNYEYDPFFQRISKEVNGVEVYFMYGLNGLAAEYDSSGNLIKEYQYPPDGRWMTSPLFQRYKGKVYYYQNNHLGTPLRLFSNSGEVVWKAAYDSFGKAVIEKNHISNNLRMPGQYYDEETQLYYNFYRYYSPELGRYIQADYIGVYGGINVYSYASQNPLIYIDPTGQIFVPGMIAGSVIGGVGAGISNFLGQTACGNKKIDWNSFVSSVVGGMVSGAIIGAAPVGGYARQLVGATFKRQVAGGSIGGIVEGVLNGSIDGTDDGSGLEKAVAIGGAGGALGGGVTRSRPSHGLSMDPELQGGMRTTGQYMKGSAARSIGAAVGVGLAAAIGSCSCWEN
ncbi:RHS repeat-associated core domain-containing protein [Hahella sp. NBU794]|uniref:RHS repeat-associated core domain-containing protein n=1 Tax=Hahella sp. NBU794 TaxID=3422590 RepID=UPI003D6FC119